MPCLQKMLPSRYRWAGRIAARLAISAAILSVAILYGQSGSAPVADTVESHVAAAKAAAGSQYDHIFHLLCDPVTESDAAPSPGRAGKGGGAGRQGPPNPSTWHAEPVKVFDNLFWFGQTEYSVWAVTTSEGIIVIDTIFGYSVEDEVVNGMKKVGLDPATIKYAIVSHAHSDHSGGAKYLQEHFGTRVLLSAADWDLLDTSAEPKPKRDMVVTDGQQLKLGNTVLTMYLTPGHTQGTISTIIPVMDHGQPHVAALWGGTLFNWIRQRASYITPSTPDAYWFRNYADSARRFREIAGKVGADVILSNHTDFDGSKVYLPAVAARKAGEPNPYVVGNGSVMRYLTVAEQCAVAGLKPRGGR